MDSAKGGCVSLKNFQFLLPHLPKFEGEIQELLFEIDKLVEQKKREWEHEVRSLEEKLLQKVRENQLLQNTISDKQLKLSNTSSNLHVDLSTCLDSADMKQLSHLKSTVDLMTRNYEALRKKYHKHLVMEKDKNSRTLIKLEEDNGFLLSELKNLKETSREKTEVLASQLRDEKAAHSHSQGRCSELQVQLDSLNAELEEERRKYRELLFTFQSRQLELDTLLKETSHTVESQANELIHVKNILAAKQTELFHLKAEVSIRHSELIASKVVVERLEAAVSKHISLLSVERDPDSSGAASPVSSASSATQTADGDVNGKLTKLEQRLVDAQQNLRHKIREINRLETACRVASTTIRRLIKAKTLATEEMGLVNATLRTGLNTVQTLYKRLNELEDAVSRRMSEAGIRVKRLAQCTNQLRSHQAKSRTISETRSVYIQKDFESCLTTNSVFVQTGADHTDSPYFWPNCKIQMLRSDGLAAVQKLQQKIDLLANDRCELQYRLEQQTAWIKQLQKDNQELTNLLTDADNSNRMSLSCLAVTQNMQETTAAEFNDTSSPDFRSFPKTQYISQPSTTGSAVMNLPLQMHPQSRVLADGDASLYQHSSESSCVTLPATSIMKLTKNDLSDSQHGSRVHEDYGCCITDCAATFLHGADRRTADYLPLNNSAMAQAKTKSNEVIDSTVLSVSPSEYADFVLPTAHAPIRSEGSFDYTSSGDVTRIVPINEPMRDPALVHLVPFDQLSIESNQSRLSSKPVYSPSLRESGLHPNLRSNVCHPSNRNHSVRFSFHDGTDKVDDSNCIRSNLRQSVNVSDDFCLSPQVCSTARKSDVHPLRLDLDDEEEDTSVYCLAAKFLANEQQHSLKLEQQIDRHLDALRKQFGRCS